jgi:AcrR family transcriptional regulator
VSELSRPTAQRSDSQRTQRRLIDGVQTFVEQHGTAPLRLADIATHTGISLATAYRHFDSIDVLLQAHIVQLPQRAVDLNQVSPKRSAVSPADSTEDTESLALHRWNLAWVRACLEFGPTAVNLRSSRGFLERRSTGDPSVSLVCIHVEPLLAPLTGKPVALLLAWNALSDPREVLDMKHTLHWGRTKIARFITDATIAVAGQL